ncbi:MAG: hypothetical protein ACK2UO_03305 [Caldilineaceae bacterium]
MKAVRVVIIVMVVVAMLVLATACGRNRGSQQAPTDTPAAAVEEAATEAPTVEAEAEATVEEVATEVPEAEATAEDVAEASVEEAATEVPEAETTAEGEAEATVEGAATEVPEAEATAEATIAPTAEADATQVAAEEVVGEEAKSEAEAMANPAIQVISEASIADVTDNKNPSLVTLSTSGDRLTWPQSEGRLWNREGELCLYTFETAASDCNVAPDTYDGYPYAFFWSPDDRYIAFTEDPVTQGNESDIWVFDTTNNAFVDLTDDGVQGSWVAAESGTFELDYLPMWNAQDGQIYFWRSIPNPEVPISMTLSIMKIAPEGGQPEEVRQVQNDMGGNLILFKEEAWFMDGVSALSPDGRQVAVIPVNEDQSDTADSNSNGLWVVDVSDTSVPPRQVATSDDFQTANLTWTGSPLYPTGLSWQADGKHLVVLTQNNNPQMPVVVLYYVDVESGEMTPVVDFSNVADEQAYMSMPDDKGVPLRFYSPWTASMSPDNEQLLMYQNLAGAAGLLVSPLPPTGDLPGMVFESQLQDVNSTPRSSRSKDGKVLMFNVLFNTTQQ